MSLISLSNSSCYIDNANAQKLDYIIVFAFLAISGNPIVGYANEWLYIIAMLLLFVYAVFNNKNLKDEFISKWIVGFAFVFFSQFVIGEFVSIPADINFLAKLYSSYLVASILSDRFRYVYLRVMVFISLISFPLFAINYLGVEFSGIRIDRYVSLIIYNYIPRSQYVGMRNCGMFWEPGAFQGYLMLVPLMYIGTIRSFARIYKKECIILVGALLSTMSTTGYLSFFVLLLLVTIKNVKSGVLRVFFVVVVIIVSQWFINKFDFMGAKLASQYDSAVTMSEGDISWTRMGAAQIDISNIKRHPIVGNGFLMEQKYPGIGELMAGAGNGFTGVVNSFGIPLMFVFFVCIYKRAPSSSSYDRMIFLIIYIMLLNGEYFLNYPLFWIFLFLNYPNILNYDGQNQ